ncbi:MAG TPA: Mrp/NBP35 family ATP-binding protein [Clostridia bacterium]|nr:Mrp/NBP35 family ATP-binding protein [Clostridia bacterium]
MKEREQKAAGAGAKKPEKIPQSEFNNIKNVIAVMSGKGGVGKSTVSALFASSLARSGYKVGVMDADITGPSIPKMFGLKGRPGHTSLGVEPALSTMKIKIMSINLLLENEDDPVIWRGPLMSGVIKQFWTEVVWGELDYLIVDLPPGTGDAPLTVMQSLPLDGLIMVTSPQEVAAMVVRKAVKMAEMMKVPMLGLIENMSYAVCPNCGEKIEVFGPSHVEEIAKGIELPLIGRIPLDPKLAELCDQGLVENYETDVFSEIVPKDVMDKIDE